MKYRFDSGSREYLARKPVLVSVFSMLTFGCVKMMSTSISGENFSRTVLLYSFYSLSSSLPVMYVNRVSANLLSSCSSLPGMGLPFLSITSFSSTSLTL